MKSIRIAIGFLGVMIIMFIFSACSYNEQYTSDSILKKQWYLENTGDASCISSSSEYLEYLTMEPGVDIGYSQLLKVIKKNSFEKGVIVAVIDTGVDFNHEALKAVKWCGKKQMDYPKNNGNYIIDKKSQSVLPSNDDTISSAHGTKCAGIIAAQNNKEGFVGIASMCDPKIMSINLTENFSSNDLGGIADLIAAIEFAESNGAKICNISLSTDIFRSELEKVMEASKMLFVVSAGNSPTLGVNIDKKPVYPASFILPNVITVANLAYDGKLNRHSNYGSNSVDIAAPGTCIYSTTFNNDYDFSTGTSVAAPMVTAAAAILYAYDGKLPASEAKDIIMDSVDKRIALENKVKSGGFLNASKAVEYLLDNLQ